MRWWEKRRPNVNYSVSKCFCTNRALNKSRDNEARAENKTNTTKDAVVHKTFSFCRYLMFVWQRRGHKLILNIKLNHSPTSEKNPDDFQNLYHILCSYFTTYEWRFFSFYTHISFNALSTITRAAWDQVSEWQIRVWEGFLRTQNTRIFRESVTWKSKTDTIFGNSAQNE